MWRSAQGARARCVPAVAQCVQRSSRVDGHGHVMGCMRRHSSVNRTKADIDYLLSERSLGELHGHVHIHVLVATGRSYVLFIDLFSRLLFSDAAGSRARTARDMAPMKPGDPGYAVALVSSCAFFMVCSAGMLVFNKLVLRAIKLPITVCAVGADDFSVV